MSFKKETNTISGKCKLSSLPIYSRVIGNKGTNKFQSKDMPDKTKEGNKTLSSPKCENKNLKDLNNDLKDLKNTFKSCIENIALKKFPEKIIEFKEERTVLSKQISNLISDKSSSEIVIPVKDSLTDTLHRMQSECDSVSSWVKKNPTLQCYQLFHKPVLFQNCRLQSNTMIVRLIAQIKSHVIDLDQDLNKLDCGIKLTLPKMRDGEYVGIELLEEVIDRISTVQASLNNTVSKLTCYHTQRAENVINILRYAHIEDYRHKLAKFDRKYCFILTKCINDIYSTYVVIYNLIRKNYSQLVEFRNMSEDPGDSSVDCSFYS